MIYCYITHQDRIITAGIGASKGLATTAAILNLSELNGESYTADWQIFYFRNV